MNKNNKIVIGVLVVFVALALYLYYSGSISYFTQSNYWPDTSIQMVMMDSSGNLVFQPATKIDEAINATTNSLKSNLNPIIGSKLATTTASNTYLTKTAAGTIYAKNNEAVKYNDKFRLTTEAEMENDNGQYARRYGGRVGWNAWSGLKDNKSARWLIQGIP